MWKIILKLNATEKEKVIKNNANSRALLPSGYSLLPVLVDQSIILIMFHIFCVEFLCVTVASRSL